MLFKNMLKNFISKKLIKKDKHLGSSGSRKKYPRKKTLQTLNLTLSPNLTITLILTPHRGFFPRGFFLAPVAATGMFLQMFYIQLFCISNYLQHSNKLEYKENEMTPSETLECQCSLITFIMFV